MNGAHDLGGSQGWGRVRREQAEPVFHDPWEGRVLALNLAMAAWGKWNIDQSRFSRENVSPARYLAAGYYQRMLYGLEFQLTEAGFIDAGEIEARMARLAGDDS